MRVSSVDEMRAMDRYAIDHYGIADELLMENAGLAACQVIERHTGVSGRRFCIFCGLGNNGGDGFVVARKIFSNGAKVTVFVLGDPDRFQGIAALNAGIVKKIGIPIVPILTQDALTSITSDIEHCHGIVDAIFGTGLARNVEGRFRDVIRMINRSGKTVFSLDIPSGIHGNNGREMGISVCADYTITFGLPKIGNMLYPGYDRGGKLYVTHISFPPRMHASKDLKVAVNTNIPLPPRAVDGHKGTFGQALFIAGASSYYGAPYFAASSFLKAGGGYSRLAAPASIISSIANRCSEIVFIPQTETTHGAIAMKNFDDLMALSEKMDIVVIGPGLSLDEEPCRLVKELAEKITRPLIIDGDGITALCDHPDIIKNRKVETVLTPHLGEMARITKLSIDEIREDPVGVVQKTAKDLGAVIVLKGAHTLISNPRQQVCINMTGNCGMGTAGSGDVLTGTIATMHGLGLNLEDAARKGVFIHGFAGDLAAVERGQDGITAQDILDFLPMAMKWDRNGISRKFMERYEGCQVI